MSLVRFRSGAPIEIEKSLTADLAHLVERHLAKVEVASSSLVIRSTIYAPNRERILNLKRFLLVFGLVAQLGERCVRNAEVEGSNPFRSTTSFGKISSALPRKFFANGKWLRRSPFGLLLSSFPSRFFLNFL